VFIYRVNVVRGLWEDASHYLVPTETLYNAKLEALLNCGDFEEAMTVFDISLRKSVLKSARMVNDFLRILARLETDATLQKKILELSCAINSKEMLSAQQRNEVTNLINSLRVFQLENKNI
jgi:uncharacterized coiled-coil protein SlyX